jgi:hypothetical protein
MSLVSNWYDSRNEGWKRILFILKWLFNLIFAFVSIGICMSEWGRFGQDVFHLSYNVVMLCLIYIGTRFGVYFLLSLILWVREGFYKKK